MPASAITSAASAPALQLLVAGIVALVLLAAGAVPLARKAGGSALVYGAAAAICVLVLGTALSSLGGAAASLYAIGYARHEPAPERVLPFYPAFLAGMMLVVLADDAFTFLFGWEFMSLASFALVVSHHGVAENVRAGLVYLMMAAFGTLALMLAFGLLAAGGEGFSLQALSFSAMRAHGPTPLAAAVVLGLALLGAGSKAGLVPLHVWLPLAHPAAPSHVSALMSGVMTKVAVYGFIRIVFDLAGPPAWWWGVPVLLVAGPTAVAGVLYALMQTDVKRVLACSTIENIGIIFVGLGLALAFEANGAPAVAALALTAALFHVVNHALFKSLLFFGAGAVLVATGEKRMGMLGGLIHAMPQTALAMLVGAAAISALPPLNGFVSEWLTFQAILLSPDLPVWGLKMLIPAVGALLALAAALAAACFVRLYGIVFLGRPRSAAASQAREADGFTRTAMASLAVLCLAAGILPGPVIDALQGAVAPLVGVRMTGQGHLAWLSIIPVAEGRSSYNGFLVFVFIALSASLAALAVHAFGSRAVRRAPAWDCGFPGDDPLAQYSAESFAQPLRRVFGRSLFAARETVTMPPPGDMAPARLSVSERDPAWAFLFAPLGRAVSALSGRANAIAHLNIRNYLALVFGALVLLLVVLALWA